MKSRHVHCTDQFYESASQIIFLNKCFSFDCISTLQMRWIFPLLKHFLFYNLVSQVTFLTVILIWQRRISHFIYTHKTRRRSCVTVAYNFGTVSFHTAESYETWPVPNSCQQLQGNCLQGNAVSVMCFCFVAIPNTDFCGQKRLMIITSNTYIHTYI